MLIGASHIALFGTNDTVSGSSTGDSTAKPTSGSNPQVTSGTTIKPVSTQSSPPVRTDKK